LEKSKSSWVLVVTAFALIRGTFGFEASFPLSEKEQIQVLSEKAYQWPKEKKFEAVGNVVITQGAKTIYGKKASISGETGEAMVMGNVRYIGPKMTLHGTKFNYNFRSKFFSVENAKLLTGNFTLFAKTVFRKEIDKIVALNAEFSTCKDCPKSWSIYGKKVEIIPGEYIHVTNGFLVIEGISFLYIPYLVFPIKTGRQTGLLLPDFSISKLVGVILKQPFYWVIDDNIDLTMEPGIYGRRGLYNELQYRHVLGEKKWFEINSNQVWDRVYLPYKVDFERSGENYFRTYADYEHQLSFGHNFNHHINIQGMKDLDMVHDFAPFIFPSLEGSEIGVNGYLNFRNPFFDFGLSSSYNRNLLVRDPLYFDKSYVQILPELNLLLPPIPLLQSTSFPMKSLSTGLEVDYSVFRQAEKNELQYIRNANRLNFRPYLDWSFGNLGPIFLNSNLLLDSQIYHFPYEREKQLFKYTFLVKTQMKIELEKIIGVAFREREKVDTKVLKLQADERRARKKDPAILIEKVPEIELDGEEKTKLTIFHSYKHSQQFFFNHYHTEETRFLGNKRFPEQIKTDLGTFDNIDAQREDEYLINNTTARILLPVKNTLEFKWKNFLMKKIPQYDNPFTQERNLWDNFQYQKIFYLDFGQGYRFDVESNSIVDKLTRMELSMGLNFKEFSLDLEEYFFWKEKGHIFFMNFKYRFAKGNLGLLMNFNSFVLPSNKQSKLSGNYRALDILSLRVDYDYDFGNMKVNEFLLGTTYIPTNDCWSLDLRVTQIDRKLSVKFNINYNPKAFKSYGR
jgi:LPS-assembly protein